MKAFVALVLFAVIGLILHQFFSGLGTRRAAEAGRRTDWPAPSAERQARRDRAIKEAILADIFRRLVTEGERRPQLFVGPSWHELTRREKELSVAIVYFYCYRAPDTPSPEWLRGEPWERRIQLFDGSKRIGSYGPADGLILD